MTFNKLGSQLITFQKNITSFKFFAPNFYFNLTPLRFDPGLPDLTQQNNLSSFLMCFYKSVWLRYYKNSSVITPKRYFRNFKPFITIHNYQSKNMRKLIIERYRRYAIMNAYLIRSCFIRMQRNITRCGAKKSQKAYWWSENV